MRPPRRRLACLLLGTAAALAGGRLAAVEGLFFPIRVLGPSMAPTLWGPSYQQPCPACQTLLRVHDHPANPLPATLLCPHCGEAVPSAEARPAAGEPVLIDRGAYWWRSPRRGDWVAIRREQAPWQVKRIVGLPGDTLTLQGDALRINKRPIDTLLPPETIPRIEVFTHRGELTFPVRGEKPELKADVKAAVKAAVTGREAAESFDKAAAGAGSPGAPPDRGRWQPSPQRSWQVYHHRAIHDEGRPGPIRDDYPANTAVARQLHPVPRLGLAGELRSPQPVVLEVAIWQAEGTVSLQARFPAGAHAWSVSSLAAAGVGSLLQPAPRWEMVAPPGDEIAVPSPLAPERPVAVRIRGGSPGSPVALSAPAQLADLRVFRHGYWYVRPRELSNWPAASLRLEAEHYFVLGDNVPLSDDSRAAPAGVPRTEIVGRVIRRPWPGAWP